MIVSVYNEIPDISLLLCRATGLCKCTVNSQSTVPRWSTLTGSIWDEDILTKVACAIHLDQTQLSNGYLLRHLEVSSFKIKDGDICEIRGYLWCIQSLQIF